MKMEEHMRTDLKRVPNDEDLRLCLFHKVNRRDR